MSRTDCRAGRAFTATCLFALCLAAPERSAAADGELDPTFSTNGWTVESPASLDGPLPKASGVAPGGRVYTMAERTELDGTPSLFRVSFKNVAAGVVGVDHEFLGFPGPGQPPPPVALSVAGAAPSVIGDGWYYLFAIQRLGEPAYLGVGAENFEGSELLDYNDDFEPLVAIGGAQEPAGLASVLEDDGSGPATRAVAAVNESSGASSWAVLRRFGNDFGTVPLAKLWPNGAAYVAFAGVRAQGVIADPQGRLVAFGSLDDFAWIARVLPNGDPDPSFDGDGQKTLALAATPGSDRFAIRRLQVDALGSIYLLGTRADGDGFGHMVLGKLDDSGQPAASFGVGGFVSRPDGDLLAGLAIQSDGKLVVAGQRGDSQRPQMPAPDLVGRVLLQRFLSNGALDPTFGVGGETEVDLGRLSPTQDGAVDVVLQGGRAVVYGFSSDESGPGLLFARFRSNLIFADGFDAGTLAGWLQP
jgi:hypothetical protein